MLRPLTRFSALKRWATKVAKRHGMKRAKVALACLSAAIVRRNYSTAVIAVTSATCPCGTCEFRCGRVTKG